MNNREKITAALNSLLQRQSKDAFVIIEEAETKKFVQFLGSTTEPLTLDVPSQTLSELEFYRAVSFFQKIDVVGTESDLLDQPFGEVVARQFSFTKVFGSVMEATQVAEDIFDKVYNFPKNCNLLIVEN